MDHEIILTPDLCLHYEKITEKITDLCQDFSFTVVQKRISSTMPWVGLYIAAASFVCFLLMTADTISGIRSKKLWFPCRYFCLNAASLTLLAVAEKLTVDLNTATQKEIHLKVAKLSSIVLINTAIGCFMPSLGSMNNQEILANVTALGIFVVTALVNMSLQHPILGGLIFMFIEYISGLFFLFCLFLSLVSSSLSIPAIKKYIDVKYQEMHNLVSNKEEGGGESSLKNLKSLIKRYWVMAATGNPQFVMARTATCAMSGFACLLCALILALAEILMLIIYKGEQYADSDYKWSTNLILVIQSLGVAAGVIPPTSRWFFSLSFKFSETGSIDYRNMLRTENFWTQRLEEWRDSSLSLTFRNTKCRKLLQNTKYVILSVCIKLQILVVVSCKLLLLFHVFFLSPFLLFLNHVKRFNRKHKSESRSAASQSGQESEPETELDLNRYVILLEGEAQLPKRTLRNIFFEVDRLILVGKRKQPNTLLELLQGDCSFKYVDVIDFENDQIPSLHSQEPPCCWTLPVVTLTSIALALPNIENHTADHLLRSVSDGLHYANLVQKCHDSSKTAVNIQNASDILWNKVELYQKWLDQELGKIDGSTSREVLQRLAETAQRIATEFKMKTKGQMENPFHWPVEVIAANSMYRISKNILLNVEEGNEITDEQLFKKLSDTIADILASCFTNLPRVICSKSQCDAIEERESSVREAAVLFGETEKILEIVEQRQLLGIVPHQVVCIDDWRVSVKQRRANAMASVSVSSNLGQPK